MPYPAPFAPWRINWRRKEARCRYHPVKSCGVATLPHFTLLFCPIHHPNSSEQLYTRDINHLLRRSLYNVQPLSVPLSPLLSSAILGLACLLCLDFQPSLQKKRGVGSSILTLNTLNHVSSPRELYELLRAGLARFFACKIRAQEHVLQSCGQRQSASWEGRARGRIRGFEDKEDMSVFIGLQF